MGFGKVKKPIQLKAIFDSQEYERNALPNLRRWLTTSSRVIIDMLPTVQGTRVF